MIWPFITKSRHEREIAEKDRTIAYARNMEAAAVETASAWEAKFKKAITDLEREVRLSNELGAELASLRPDAQKWRDRAAREAKRGQNRKASGR